MHYLIFTQGAGNLNLHQNLCRDVYSNFSIIAQTWKQPKCPSGGEWKDKVWYIQTEEYNSALK